MKLAVNHSIISSDSLRDTLNGLYAIGNVQQCRFLQNGLNDTYAVKTASDNYILRIYKSHWRNKEEILFEVELLTHLNRKKIPVSSPVPTANNEYLFGIDAPEGLRFAVLFTYANGEYSDDEAHCALFGKEVAKMHVAMDDFQSSRTRFHLDLSHLLNEPLQKIHPFLSHRPHDIDYLEGLSKDLRSRIEMMATELDWGLCHGDLHGGNVHYSGDTLTQFDFDCGGWGWRAYDVSVFLWNTVSTKSKEAYENKKWTIFLNAYQKVRPLSDRDIKAIPLFVAARDIWLMGLHTGNAHIWGSWQNDHYFDQHVKFLRDWCEYHGIV